MVSARASGVPLLNFVSSDRGCCPIERPLGMGEKSKRWLERRGGGFIRNEGEAECSRGVEAEGTTLTAHTMRRYGRGRAKGNRAKRASALGSLVVGAASGSRINSTLWGG